ncbi:ErfK/YbiS/YcfS/YnhG family protein [Latilactobacillus sakei]|uniref:L,D-transpeptidase family protein n=1 Tax=Latilactobacillus sakei TaxID=1599 RepID=UPI000C6F401A|nr:peptidoglycan binding domain-containing protein [Latilactobacillus sakei]SON68875.1 ErfK/YbiS/YcfS/YnhG family protein [Latilactobacillus sakei]
MKVSKKAYTALGVAAVILIGGYSAMSLHYNKVFLPNTVVAGTNISGKSPAEANEALLKQVNHQKFTLKEDQTTRLSFTAKDAGFSHNFQPLLKKIQSSQNGWSWLGHQLSNPKKLQSENALILNQQTFKQFANQTVTKLNTGRTASKNATIKLVNENFEIVKEVNGNQIDQAQFEKTINKAINQGKTSIDLKQDYTVPTIKSTDSALQKTAKKMTTISDEKIHYSVNGNEFTVPKATIQGWLVNNNGTVSLDKTAVSNYVYQLKTKYDTYDKPLTFKSTKQGTVTVPAGIYGWSISPADEISALMKEVPEGKDFSRTAVIRGSGMTQKDRSVGSTYIEIDKKAQHMWLYQNGKVTIQTDVVTARPPQTTPSGVWSIWKKERNATLKGTNFDGVSEYASPVNYWMPIDETGVGIHDSPWQPKYGGTWYKEHGSHGCINTPPTIMAQLYNTVSEGIPVVVI